MSTIDSKFDAIRQFKNPSNVNRIENLYQVIKDVGLNP